MSLLYRQIRQRQAASLALQSVTARVSDIVESAMDPIVTIDAAQRIVLFNAAAEKVFGWPREQSSAQPLDKLSRSGSAARHREHIERFGRTGTTSRRMGGRVRIVAGLRANGEEFPIEASISQAQRRRTAACLTVILRDVSRAHARSKKGCASRRRSCSDLGAAAQ